METISALRTDCGRVRAGLRLALVLDKMRIIKIMITDGFGGWESSSEDRKYFISLRAAVQSYAHRFFEARLLASAVPTMLASIAWLVVLRYCLRVGARIAGQPSPLRRLGSLGVVQSFSRGRSQVTLFGTARGETWGRSMKHWMRCIHVQTEGVPRCGTGYTEIVGYVSD